MIETIMAMYANAVTGPQDAKAIIQGLAAGLAIALCTLIIVAAIRHHSE